MSGPAQHTAQLTNKDLISSSDVLILSHWRIHCESRKTRT